jgi:chromosome segregation ATPase
VNKEGDVYNPSGAMSGGFTNQNEDKIKTMFYYKNKLQEFRQNEAKVE